MTDTFPIRIRVQPHALDADAVIAIRFFPRDRRADAIAFANDIVNIVA